MDDILFIINQIERVEPGLKGEGNSQFCCFLLVLLRGTIVSTKFWLPHTINRETLYQFFF